MLMLIFSKLKVIIVSYFMCLARMFSAANDNMSQVKLKIKIKNKNSRFLPVVPFIVVCVS